MTKKIQKKNKNSDLFKKVVKQSGFVTVPIEKLSDEDVRKLAHELQVRQIELKTQNEELYKRQLLIEESQQKYMDLFDFAPFGYFTLSEKGLILEANLTGAAMLGIERRLLIKEPISKFIVSEDQDRYYLYHRSIYEGKETRACELRMVKKEGVPFYVQLECALADGVGEVSGQCRVLITDITKRILAEEQVTSLSKFPSENPNPVFRIRKDGVVIYANQSSKSLLKEYNIKAGEEIQDSLRQILKSSYKSQIAKEIEITSDYRVFSLLIIPVAGTDYTNVYGRDITDRKLAEDKSNVAFAEIQKYKTNMEAIFKSIKDAIILVDRDYNIVEFNESARRICGFPDTNETRGTKFDLLHKYCEGECVDALAETKKTKLPAERNHLECFNTKMCRCLVSVITYPLLDSNGQFNGCVIVVRDETRLAALESTLQERHQFRNIIGKSKELQKIFSLIEILSETQTTVLITGENGTGKRLVAEALYYHGKVQDNAPFVVVSCSSLSDNLLESELFGHVKGAYTGAINDRVGRFQKAEGGTIFLDEIGDVSSAMQLRLLRILEERVFERLGDSETITANVRIVAATNQDLQAKVRDGKFREDLYHRLKVVELRIPALRDRREDIPLLVEYFIEKLNTKLNKNVKAISTEVKTVFMDYNWPGNIRELYNTMEYAFITCDNSLITIDNLPSDFANTRACDRRHVETGKITDRQQIVQALEKAGGNKSKAARILGIHRVTIYKMMKKYDIIE